MTDEATLRTDKMTECMHIGRPITVGHPKDVENTLFRNVGIKPLSYKVSELSTLCLNLLQTLFKFAACIVLLK